MGEWIFSNREDRNRRTDHDLDYLLRISYPAVMRCLAGSVQDRSNPGTMF